jgi:hypothetical protein
MTGGPPGEMTRILERGSFCHVATLASRRPHVTPMVFAFSGGRLWVTTSRGSVKTRAWARDAAVAGLVCDGDVALSFVGRAEAFDLLDADTWGRAVRETPALAAATVRFTRKNARFFAGYAVDARHVPLSWTPPGRVFVQISIERAAVVGDEGVRETWSDWPSGLVARERFRASRTGSDPLAGLPVEVRGPLRDRGVGALAILGRGSLVVLPVQWAVDGPMLLAALPEAVVALAGCDSPEVSVALALDRASWWRARRMIGAMVQGTGEVFALERLVSGARSADACAELAGADPHRAALVRIRPGRVVWWHGWTSGTVPVA